MSVGDEHEKLPLVRPCSLCGGIIRKGAHAGLCPRCLLHAALKEDDIDASPFPMRFAGYELLEKLGEGGMGVVYKARQVGGIERVVALKRIRDGELADTAARRRFLAEAKAAAELRHANIVPIYEVREHDGEPYFTMELMPGGTLATAAARFAEPTCAATLVAKLARAVHAGHLKHIIHRDLKPANILFDGRGEPHVADFGVAKRLDQDGGTTTGGMVGTASYMAPEQASGHAKRDSIAADVWSLGVILYELLAGRRPFLGPTPLEVLRCVAEDEPESLESMRPSVHRDLATIAMTCLHKEPERRYISAEALAEDLERYLRGEPPLARRPGRLLRAARFCGRHPALAAFFSAAALGLVTLTLWALISAREQERARRGEVLSANVFAARAVAGTVLVKLRDYADIVTEEARHPRLTEALTRGDDEAMQALCEAAFARHAVEASPIVWWFVVDARGSLRAHAPTPQFGKSYYRDYSFRDYFRTAKSLSADTMPHVYVSRAFRATSDDRYKLAIVAPLRGEHGVFAGLLAAEIATDRRLGDLDLSDERRIAVLTVRRDRDLASDALPDESILLVHDGVTSGEGVVVESDALRRLTARRDAAKVAPEAQLRLPPPEWVEAEDDYTDRLAKPDPDGKSGPWLAGVAPVGKTELSVIVETRLNAATALDRSPFRVLAAWSVGGAALLFVGLFAALRTRARRA